MTLSFCPCGGIKGQCKCKPDDRRLSTTERGYGYDWQVVSKRYRRENPLCERCLESGKITPTAHAHHKIRIKDNEALRLDVANLMAVCIACHEIVEAENG